MKNNFLSFKWWLKNLAFLASIVTIFGVPSLWLQFQELNAKAKIDIKLSMATSTVSFGKFRTEPFNFFVTAHNSGDFMPTAWRGSLMFCNNIEVIESDSEWKKDSDLWYVLDSQKPLIPHLIIETTALDEVGTFKITLPSENYHTQDWVIPVALVYVAGEKNESTFKLNSLSENGFISEEIYTRNGKLISDIQNCRVIQ